MALAALRARGAPARVLVVCNGNIFRSPFAAEVLRREPAGRRLMVASGGLLGPGRPSPDTALTAAKSFGVDLAPHRSQLVTAELAQWADLVLVMDERQRRELCERFARSPRDVVLLGDLDPEGAERRAIEDPWEQSLDVCQRSYARIERCVKEFAQAIRGVAKNGRPK